MVGSASPRVLRNLESEQVLCSKLGRIYKLWELSFQSRNSSMREVRSNEPRSRSGQTTPRFPLLLRKKMRAGTDFFFNHIICFVNLPPSYVFFSYSFSLVGFFLLAVSILVSATTTSPHTHTHKTQEHISINLLCISPSLSHCIQSLTYSQERKGGKGN